MPSKNKLKKAYKGIFLQILNKMEKEQPEKTYRLNVFNSGFYVNSDKVRSFLIKTLKKVMKPP